MLLRSIFPKKGELVMSQQNVLLNVIPTESVPSAHRVTVEKQRSLGPILGDGETMTFQQGGTLPIQQTSEIGVLVHGSQNPNPNPSQLVVQTIQGAREASGTWSTKVVTVDPGLGFEEMKKGSGIVSAIEERIIAKIREEFRPYVERTDQAVSLISELISEMRAERAKADPPRPVRVTVVEESDENDK